MVRLRERATGLHCHSSVVVGSRAGIETHIGSNELSINFRISGVEGQRCFSFTIFSPFKHGILCCGLKVL